MHSLPLFLLGAKYVLAIIDSLTIQSSDKWHSHFGGQKVI